jgi:NADPH:quinone reductase-like Zn-dependent oxidoreductase
MPSTPLSFRVPDGAQNEAAAQNPTDWKHLKFKLAGPGKVLGCDLAGTIVSAKDTSLIGKRVTSSFCAQD